MPVLRACVHVLFELTLKLVSVIKCKHSFSSVFNDTGIK